MAWFQTGGGWNGGVLFRIAPHALFHFILLRVYRALLHSGAYSRCSPRAAPPPASRAHSIAPPLHALRSSIKRNGENIEEMQRKRQRRNIK